MELEVGIERRHTRAREHDHLGAAQAIMGPRAHQLSGRGALRNAKKKMSVAARTIEPSAIRVRGGPERFSGTEARSTRATIGASLYSVSLAFSIVDSSCSLSAVKRNVSARSLSSWRLRTGLCSVERIERSERLFIRKV